MNRVIEEKIAIYAYLELYCASLPTCLFSSYYTLISLLKLFEISSCYFQFTLEKYSVVFNHHFFVIILFRV